MAKIERGNFELNLEKIDLREILDAITESVGLRVEKEDWHRLRSLDRLITFLILACAPVFDIGF